MGREDIERQIEETESKSRFWRKAFWVFLGLALFTPTVHWYFGNYETLSKFFSVTPETWPEFWRVYRWFPLSSIALFFILMMWSAFRRFTLFRKEWKLEDEHIKTKDLKEQVEYAEANAKISLFGVFGVLIGLAYFVISGFPWWLNALPAIMIFMLFREYFRESGNLSRLKRLEKSEAKATAEQDGVAAAAAAEKARATKCRRVLARYLPRLKKIEYDDVSRLEHLIDDGISPKDLEDDVLAALGEGSKKPVEEEKAEEFGEGKGLQTAEYRGKQELRDKAIADKKERIADIEARVKAGELTAEEGKILIEAANRDLEKRLHAIDNL